MKFVIYLATIVAMVIGVSAFAATAEASDGQTPADEGVCDILREDGTSKGLYGLCIAFCEAQDFADPGTAMTEQALQDLMDGAPSGKLLRNYNRKKKASDPDMPCMVSVPDPEPEICPCFTDAELQTIDGFHNDWGYQLNNFTCLTNDDTGTTRYSQIYESSPTTWALVADAYATGEAYCTFTSLETGDRSLSTSVGTLTHGEMQSCRTKLHAYIPASGCGGN